MHSLNNILRPIRLGFGLLTLAVLAACGGQEQAHPDARSPAQLATVAAVAAPTPATVVSLEKVKETRISRTIYEYEFRVVVRNGAQAQSKVVALLTRAGNGTVIGRGQALVGDMAAGQLSSSQGTITLRQDRTFAFNPADLVWQLTGTVTVEGSLALKNGDRAANYTVMYGSQAVVPSAKGMFTLSLPSNRPSLVIATSRDNGALYGGIAIGNQLPLTLNAATTAEALVLSSPALVTVDETRYLQLAALVHGNPEVGALATLIDTLYAQTPAPLSDPRMADAIGRAVVSVLADLKATTGDVRRSARATTLASTQATQPNALASSAADGSVLTLHPGRLAVVTFDKTPEQNLQLKLATTGPLGATENVDWVAKIVELDPARIPRRSDGSLDISELNLDSLRKTGGFERTLVVNGTVSNSWWTDPLGSFIEQMGNDYLPDMGVHFSHDGIYAVMAFSGNPINDAADLQAIRSNPEKRRLWDLAFGLNVTQAALSMVTLTGDFAGDTNHDMVELLGSVLSSNIMVVDNLITSSNPSRDQIFELIKTIAGTAIDAVMESKTIDASIKQAESRWYTVIWTGMQHTTRPLSVFEDALGLGARVLDFLFNVTPSEWGYVTLLPDAGAGQVPVVSAIAPVPVVADGTQQTITITGHGFMAGRSGVQFKWGAGSGAGAWGNPYDGTVTVLSPTQIRIQMRPRAVADTIFVRVCNDGNICSNGTTAFRVVASALTVTSVSPSIMTADGTRQMMTISGSGFVRDSSGVQFKWGSAPGAGVWDNPYDGTVTFDSPSQIRVLMRPRNVADTIFVRVCNDNIVCTDGSAQIRIVAATPNLTSVTPTSMPADGVKRNITLYGSGFASGSVVQFSWAVGDGAGVWHNATSPATIDSSSQIRTAMNPGTVTDRIAVRVCTNGLCSDGRVFVDVRQ